MPQNVAHMEQQAVSGRAQGYYNQSNDVPPPNGQSYGYKQQPQSNSYSQAPPAPGHQTYQQQQYSTALSDQPNFSPFPVLRNPPPNIPPTDEQKEVTLEGAREAVLSCNDPETQLTWAQDTLQYVEVAQQNEHRISATQSARSRTPRIEHQLREDAFGIVNFLADQRHPKAEFLRGMWLEFGKFGERVDKKEAFQCYTRAAEKGYARAQYRIGMQFEASNDALKAVKYYQRGADIGDSASCYRLGMMTLLGQHGQPQDYERGLNLIYQASESADENAPQGAYVFGMLQAGELPQIKVPEQYLPKNYSAAKINVEKAAYLGFSKAQLKMGSAYELGELGCPFDAALSLHYNALAARQGESEAEMAISKWFLCGQEGVFEKSEELAFTYAQRAAVGGLSTAQFAMGYFYEVGIYVQINFATAQDWYRQAAQGGNQDAAGRVDAIKRSKTLSRKHHESVAVEKIRQQHGAGRQGAPPMPTVSEAYSPALDMPDPSRLSLNPSGHRPPYSGHSASRPGMPSSNSIQDFRPTSAFGINPNLRPNTASPHPNGYASNENMPPPRPPYNQPRPNTGPGPQAQGYPPQSRPPPRASTTSPYPPQQPQRIATAPPGVDIGYTAPLDPRPERRYYDQYSTKPQPPAPGQAALPPRLQSRPTQPLQSGSSRPTGSPNLQKPAPQQDRPAQAYQPPKLSQTTPQKPQKASTAPPGRQNSKPNQVSAGTKIPGKGPATFEEMGIPNKKAKGDCVSLPYRCRARMI